MRISALLASSVAAFALLGDIAIETVADDYDRPQRKNPKPATAATPEDSLRVRLLRMERERKSRRRAAAAESARSGYHPLHRRDAD